MTETTVDAVEIKFTLAATSLQPAIASFGLDRGPDKRREIWFFDSVEQGDTKPRLLQAGIILRLRRKKDGSGESTLKLRPAQPGRLVGDFRAGTHHFGENYSVEYDWAAHCVLAASMKADVTNGDAEKMIDLKHPISARYSPDQLRLLHEAGTPPPDPFAGLRAAGPITAKRWDDLGTGLLAGLRAEHWTYDGDRQFLELSLQRSDVADATKSREALLADLARRGLQLDPAGVPKTETVLMDLLDGHPHP